MLTETMHPNMNLSQAYSTDQTQSSESMARRLLSRVFRRKEPAQVKPTNGWLVGWRCSKQLPLRQVVVAIWKMIRGHERCRASQGINVAGSMKRV
jgi:hypothetical protein